jgi:site-specific recombinase XerD
MIELVPDWRRHLRAKNLGPGTIRSYMYCAEKFCESFDGTTALSAADAAHSALPAQIESYLADVLDRSSASNAAKHYRSLQQFVRWLVDEGELSTNPMARIHAPRIPEKPVAIFTDAELVRLLAACKGNALMQRRNAAILRTSPVPVIRPSDFGYR